MLLLLFLSATVLNLLLNVGLVVVVVLAMLRSKKDGTKKVRSLTGTLVIGVHALMVRLRDPFNVEIEEQVPKSEI